jgi:hypothetical protein
MDRWDRDGGLQDTLTDVCEVWNDVLEVTEQHQLNIETLHIVAGVLVRVGLFTGRTDFTAAYELLYASIRLHVTSGNLDQRTGEVLARIFGGHTMEDLTVKGLEAGYLRANPVDVDEEEPIAVGVVPVIVSIPDPVEAVYLPGLVAMLLAEQGLSPCSSPSLWFESQSDWGFNLPICLEVLIGVCDTAF